MKIKSISSNWSNYHKNEAKNTDKLEHDRHMKWTQLSEENIEM